MAAIEVGDAEARFSEPIARAAAGETTPIVRDGKPVAHLAPLKRSARRQPIAPCGKFDVGPEFFEPLDESELAAWEGAFEKAP